jgi:hypothetical protein
LCQLSKRITIYTRHKDLKYEISSVYWGIRVMVLDATFHSISFISWGSVLLVEEIGVPGEYHWPVASHGQTLSDNVVSSFILYLSYMIILFYYIKCILLCKNIYIYLLNLRITTVSEHVPSTIFVCPKHMELSS